MKELLSVAPMMDWTTPHFRKLLRIVSKETVLYTEMVVDDSVIHNTEALEDRIGLPEIESGGPAVIQLGGSNPESIAKASEILNDYGILSNHYQELNLNCGCPSTKVQKNCFGAKLMLDPPLVREIVYNMQRRVSCPVTVKCRLGVTGHRDTYENLVEFITEAHSGGAKKFIIHCRDCVLEGFTTKQNREIPPLRYNEIKRLRETFPDLEFVLNGGVKSLEEVKHHLYQDDESAAPHGVMIGRAIMNNPLLLCNADTDIFGCKSNPGLSRREIIEEYGKYCDLMQDRMDSGTLKDSQNFHKSIESVRNSFRRTLLCAAGDVFHGISNSKDWKKLTHPTDEILNKSFKDSSNHNSDIVGSYNSSISISDFFQDAFSCFTDKALDIKMGVKASDKEEGNYPKKVFENKTYNNNNTDLLSNDELIYFGSRRAFLSMVEGNAHSFVPSEWETDKSEASLRLIRARNNPFPVSSESDNFNLIIPAIPAFNFIRNPNSKELNNNQFPDELKVPLLKTKENKTKENQEPLRAVVSGIRSCIVRTTSGWYRLKGCGNNTDGIIVRKNSNGTTDLRGVAFPHTAIRELAMTSRLEEELLDHDVVNANKAIGWWSYTGKTPFASEETSVNDIQPTCIVEQTFGDRRLGTHVLSGLEVLLPSLLSKEIKDDDYISTLTSLFHTSRPDPLCYSTSEILSDHMLARELYMSGAGDDVEGLMWPNISRGMNATCFANAYSWFNLDDEKSKWSSPLSLFAPDQNNIPKQWSLTGSEKMSYTWQKHWKEACAKLSEAMTIADDTNGNANYALVYTYGRIGYEIGKFLRLLHIRRISWGTYKDASCYDGQWHCNAHTNNFVVLMPDESKRKSLLGYLDLDMAFDENTFVDLLEDNELNHDKNFTILLEREYLGLLEVLAPGSDFSSGVPEVVTKEVVEQPKAIRVAAYALHDTMVLSFLKSYHNNEEIVPFNEELHCCAQALFRLAIVVMHDSVA
jgi:tRNA-dihydrouridine synthase A